MPIWPFNKKSAAIKSSPPSVGEGVCVCAVGDIHGRADLLEKLLARIESHLKTADAAEKHVVFLGDYVDRGEDSRGVIDALMSLNLPATCHFLRGNHDQMMLDFIRDPAAGSDWLPLGGRETILSYGLTHTDLAGPIEKLHADFVEKVPEEHVRFLERLQSILTFGDYVFAHAGIRPGVPLEEQVEQDLLWIREEFLGAKRKDSFVVVHGHTPTKEVYKGNSRIAVDTGAYMTGKLSCVVLDRSSFFEINSF